MRMVKTVPAATRNEKGGYNAQVVLNYQNERTKLPSPVTFVQVATSAGSLVRAATGGHPPIKLIQDDMTITGPGDFDSLMSTFGEGDIVEIKVKIDRDHPKSAAYANLAVDDQESFVDGEDETATLRNYDDDDDGYVSLTSAPAKHVDHFLQPVKFTEPFIDAEDDSRSQKITPSLSKFRHGTPELPSRPIAAKTVSQARTPTPTIPVVRPRPIELQPKPIPVKNSSTTFNSDSEERKRPLAPTFVTSAKRSPASDTQVGTTGANGAETKVKQALRDPACVEALAGMIQSPAMRPVIDKLTNVLISEAPTILHELAFAMEKAPGLASLFPSETLMTLIVSAAARSQEIESKSDTSPPVANIQSDYQYRPLGIVSATKATEQAKHTIHQGFRKLTTSSSPPEQGYQPMAIQTEQPVKPRMVLDEKDDTEVELLTDRMEKQSSRSKAIESDQGSDFATQSYRSIAREEQMAAARKLPQDQYQRNKVRLVDGSTSIIVTRGVPEAVLSWKLSNSDYMAWPRSLMFLQKKGNLDAQPVTLHQQRVGPSQTVTVESLLKLRDFKTQSAIFQLYDADHQTWFGPELPLEVVALDDDWGVQPRPTPSAPPMRTDNDDWGIQPRQAQLAAPRRPEPSHHSPIIDDAMMHRVSELAEEFGVDFRIVLDVVLEEHPVDYDRCRAKLIFLTESSS